MIVRKDLADLVNRYGMGYQIQKANEQYKKEPESQEKKQERREQSHTKPQRILITWLTEHPEIYPYIRSYVSADDFLNPLYHSVAIMLFEQLDQGQAVNPARIVNQFTEVEEQKEVAALFNAHLRYETSPEDRDKALTDVVKKILLSSIEDEMIHTGDIVKWQELLARKNKVQKLNLHLGQS